MGNKDYTVPIGQEHWIRVNKGVISQARLVSAVSVHYIYLTVAIPVGIKDYQLAIW